MKNETSKRAFLIPCCLMILFPMILSGGARAESIRHRVTGLFSPDRERDLREAVGKIPQVRLVKVDFETAEATFEYEPAKAFPGAKPEEVITRLDGLLRGASKHTFGIKPLCRVARDMLRPVEIPVAGLDCKACCLAAYEAVSRLEGVEWAAASFREGRVRALIDPTKTDRTRLEAALRRIGVEVRPR
jgi:copper chaperone CopZ